MRSIDVLPQFFNLVKRTDNASDEVDRYDPDPDSDADPDVELGRLLRIQHESTRSLIDFCKRFGVQTMMKLSEYDGLGHRKRREKGVQMRNYTVRANLGFKVDPGDIEKIFEMEVDEVSHMEDRWDPATGIKVAPERVVDRPAGTSFVIDGIDVGDDLPRLLEEIARRLGCDVDVQEDSFEGVLDFVVFAPKMPIAMEDVNHQLSVTGTVSLATLFSLLPQLDLIAQGLRAFGIPFEGPALILSAQVG